MMNSMVWLKTRCSGTSNPGAVLRFSSPCILGVLPEILPGSTIKASMLTRQPPPGGIYAAVEGRLAESAHLWNRPGCGSSVPRVVVHAVVSARYLSLLGKAFICSMVVIFLSSEVSRGSEAPCHFISVWTEGTGVWFIIFYVSTF